MSHEMILTEARGRVGLITLNRPQAMNALNNQLMRELMDALEAFDKNDAIGAMVITGNEKAFAAGADIKEMAEKSIQEMMDTDHIAVFGRIRTIRKPTVGWAGIRPPRGAASMMSSSRRRSCWWCSCRPR